MGFSKEGLGLGLCWSADGNGHINGDENRNGLRGRGLGSGGPHGCQPVSLTDELLGSSGGRGTHIALGQPQRRENREMVALEPEIVLH